MAPPPRLICALLVAASAVASASKSASTVVVLPDNVYPGYGVKRLPYVGQTFGLDGDLRVARCFDVLSDGLLMVTSNVSHLVGRPGTLILRETDFPPSPERSDREQALAVHVVPQQSMLRFPKEEYGASIVENGLPGAQVAVLDGATTDSCRDDVRYEIVSGDDDGAFHLSPLSRNSTRLVLRARTPLDRETQNRYDLTIRAFNGLESARTRVVVEVLDVNDNDPVPERRSYTFRVPLSSEPYSIVGNVSATDSDGDAVAFRLSDRHPFFTMVPKTGELMLTRGLEPKTYKLAVRLRDRGTPPRRGPTVAVYVDAFEPDEAAPASSQEDSVVRIRRSSIIVRPTKSYLYKETDGRDVNKTVFTLDKKAVDETFELEKPDRWVHVSANGDVKVKEKWDYEQLDKEKSIDFWVLARPAGNPSAKERQRIIIRIADVNDEPPYFINRPIPMQAVVQLNAPAGTPVFKLQARDPDTDHNIRYSIVRDRSGNRFDVDAHSGEVITIGSAPFMLDKEYVLYVKAEDLNGHIGDRQYQSTREERLSVVGGKRQPQFYVPSYEATIPENQKKDSDIIEVKAKSFADREIRYTLRAQGKGAGTFNIGPTSGVVKLAKELDYEDLRQPKSYSLIVTATEDSGGFSTSVELTIKVTDVNDNAPRFELPDYQAHNVDEDIAVGTSILQVSATDMDTGRNAELVYSLDKEDFTIDSRGVVYSNKRLDADVNNTYVLTVRATDRGEPPLTGTATVRIYTENKNDEAPKFSQDVYTPNVDENAGPSTLVTTVVASDKDGDNILFGFVNSGTTSGMFQIEERTGVIRLINGPIHLDKDKYELNVTARDDGACCRNGALTPHTSTALVVVFITDVNDNKPVFDECHTYTPKVEEGAQSGTSVIKVKAKDLDKGHNGQVRYSIVQQPNQKGTKFSVDELTGEIRTNKVFDREGDDGRFVSVTVKATDRGSPPLEGVCSFKVEITDINDNPPLFDRQEYRENVKQDTQVGIHILRVSASDEDADNNGAIVYNLTAPYDPGNLAYFSINPDSGWISLQKALDRDQYQLRAIALDKGVPQHQATVEVMIDVVDRANNPPIWDQPVYGPIFIRENLEVGSRVIAIKARSGIPENTDVFYTLMKGSTEQTNKKDTFYLNQKMEDGNTVAELVVNYPLDYERIQQYNLTVRVENNGIQQLASEATVYIVLEDVNDEIPLFIEREQETVLEGLPPGTKVTQVQAADKDGTYPNNKVYYAIEARDHGDKYFSIDRETGDIYTKVEFDREEKMAYAIRVRAEDGAPSARPHMTDSRPNSG
ncbi:neural-cadherin [Ixodes scapularis]